MSRTVAFGPHDVGKRISIQYFEPDGARSEAVGVLERAERQGESLLLHVRKRDDSVVQVPLHRIRFGRIVPARGPR
ncbi:MAG TPA: hypothetical protein VNE62_08200 [Actinomycetota bacterium]|nr:hypothetical protein [Actinomycetota bacterium]